MFPVLGGRARAPQMIFEEYISEKKHSKLMVI
jgi:hypothetical protein